MLAPAQVPVGQFIKISVDEAIRCITKVVAISLTTINAYIAVLINIITLLKSVWLSVSDGVVDKNKTDQQ